MAGWRSRLGELAPTTASRVVVVVAAVLGIVNGLSSDGTARILHVLAFPVAQVAIVRFVPVVRRRLFFWFAAHELAITVIGVGFAVAGDRVSFAFNGLWLLAAAVWYRSGARSRERAR